MASSDMMDRLLKAQMMGGAASQLGGLFSGGDGAAPYHEASDVMSRYYDEAKGYMLPYLQAFGDPEALQAKWAQGYQMSPYAMQMQEQAGRQGMDAASRMGMLGSTPALQAIQGGQAGIMGRDRQQYLGDLMQKYLAGAQMAQGMGSQAVGMGERMGQAAYGASSEGQRGGDMFGNLIGAASSILPFFL